MINKLWSWFVQAIKETLNLSWTLVGLIIATLTLTGQAQTITAMATVITLTIWLLTIGFMDILKKKCLDFYSKVKTNLAVVWTSFTKKLIQKYHEVNFWLGQRF